MVVIQLKELNINNMMMELIVMNCADLEKDIELMIKRNVIQVLCKQMDAQIIVKYRKDIIALEEIKHLQMFAKKLKSL